MSSREELIRYRLQRANEALEDARVLAAGNRWQACVGRLYYACFYAAIGLLLSRDLETSTHRGVRSLLNEHFVVPGLITRPLARIYNDLFERRQENDYMDFIRVTEEQVAPWIPRAEEFVAAVTALAAEPAG